MTDRLVTPPEERTPDNDIGDTVAVYIDDVCIAGEEVEQMLQRLQAFFNRVRASGFWPTPRDVKEVRSWLGLVQYYSKYVPHLATLATPLFALTRLGVEFCWTAECEEALQV